jgi:hypothetical protein
MAVARKSLAFLNFQGFEQPQAPIVPTCGLSRASFWRFSDLALAEARDVISEIENLRVVDRSEHLSPG